MYSPCCMMNHQQHQTPSTGGNPSLYQQIAGLNSPTADIPALPHTYPNFSAYRPTTFSEQELSLSPNASEYAVNVQNQRPSSAGSRYHRTPLQLYPHTPTYSSLSPTNVPRVYMDQNSSGVTRSLPWNVFCPQIGHDHGPEQSELLPQATYFNTNMYSGRPKVVLRSVSEHKADSSRPTRPYYRQVSSDHSAQIRQSDDESTDEDSSTTSPTHPNKFPVKIEEHTSKACCYKRQKMRSGIKYKPVKGQVMDEDTRMVKVETQEIKYYQKDLVRVCRCGAHTNMEGMLEEGRSNDCPGYEIHYNRKCRWKAYEDFDTKKRVLIRLCKCYKPAFHSGLADRTRN